MNVGIDVSGLFWKYRTGVQVLYYGLLEGLQQLALPDDMKFIFVDLSGQPGHTLPLGESRHYEFRGEVPLGFLPSCGDVAEQPFKAAGETWNNGVRFLRKRFARLPSYEARLLEGIDVFQAWSWDIRELEGAGHVIMVPDIIPFLYPESFTSEFIEAARRLVDFSKREGVHVISISEYTKRDLIEKVGVPAEKISVVYPGLRSVFRPGYDAAALSLLLHRYGISGGRYIVSLGYLDPRKNVRRHVEAFLQLSCEPDFDDLHLFLVGPASLATGKVMEEIGGVGAGDKVHLTGFIPDEELVLLLNGAALFLYCSLYEGFGFPVLEAMACGIPVVTSNVTSLPEVAGDAAAMVDPTDTDAIAVAMRRVLEDEGLAAEMRLRGIAHASQFTWKRWAQGHLNAYLAAAARGERAD